jgi:hypothetical protein
MLDFDEREGAAVEAWPAEYTFAGEGCKQQIVAEHSSTFWPSTVSMNFERSTALQLLQLRFSASMWADEHLMTMLLQQGAASCN